MRSRASGFIRSNVLGLVAIFIALGGTSAYALNGSNTVFSDDIVDGQVMTPDLHANAVNAVKITNNAVIGSKLAANSVTGAKVTDDSLTGADVLESTLGKVPNAALADAATSASPTGDAGGDLTGAYPNPSLKAPGPPTLAGLPNSGGDCSTVFPPNNWADLSANVNNEVGYYRDPLGRVHLQGVAKKCGTPASGDAILTLPAGFRPASLNHFGTVAADAFGEVLVDSSGNVIAAAGSFAGPGWISLDGISLRCAPSGQNGCP